MRIPDALRRLVLLSYPPSFRRRYGEELGALVHDGASRSWRDIVDLARGSATAWLVPSFAGGGAEQRRARLQATTATVFISWSASVMAAGAFARAVDDPRLPGLRNGAWQAYDVGSRVVTASVALVLASGLAYWVTVIVPAWRERRASVLVPALVPPVIVAGWLGATGLVALYAHHVVHNGNASLAWPGGVAILAVAGTYGLITVAAVAGCAWGAATALGRAELGARPLAASTVVAAVVAVGLLAQVVTATIIMARVAPTAFGIGPFNGLLGGGSAAVLVSATAIAVVSAARGVRALRPVPEDGIGAS